MIIDTHIHNWPGKGLRALPLLREECRRNGVALCLLSSLGSNQWRHYPSSKEVRAANKEACALAAHSRGLVLWYAYINPQNPNWPKEMDICASTGAVGVKLWVSLKDKHGSLANTEKVLDYAGQNKLPTLIHAYNRTSEPNRTGEITLTEFMRLAKRHPQTRMIAAHIGHNWPAETGLYRRLPNVWVDICGGYPIKGQVEVLAREIGADRILFASDWPCRSHASQLAKVILADISEADKQNILYHNAAALFGMEELPNINISINELKYHRSQCPIDAAEDHFCFCGRWPFFKTESQTPKALEDVLVKAGIKRAYTGDLGSIYRQDLLPANESFLAACRGLKRVKPLAIINPRVPDYQSVLENTSRKFAGIILFPAFHNWNLADKRHAGLFNWCWKHGIKIWINCGLGDDRYRHGGTIFRPVSSGELISLGGLTTAPEMVFQHGGEKTIDEFLKHHDDNKRFRFEVSQLTDSPDALRRIIKKHGIKNLVMGSEYPFRDIAQVRNQGQT